MEKTDGHSIGNGHTAIRVPGYSALSVPLGVHGHMRIIVEDSLTTFEFPCSAVW